VSTSPADGAVLASSPSEVRLQFASPVSSVLSALAMAGPDGSPVGVGPRVHPGGLDTAVAVKVLGSLGGGTYRVIWHVVSDGDALVGQGSLSFRVDGPQAAAVAATKPPAADSRVTSAVVRTRPGSVSFLFGLAKWLALLGFSLLVGAAFHEATWPTEPGAPEARTMMRAGWALLVASVVGLLLVRGPYLEKLPLTDGFRTEVLNHTLHGRFGRILAGALVLLLALAFAAAAGVGARLRRFPTRPAGAAVVTGTVALAVAWSIATLSDLSALPVVVDSLRLGAVGIWAGGLVMLGVQLTRNRPLEIAAFLPQFSRAAFGCVAVIVVTAIVKAEAHRRDVLPAVLGILALAAAARSWIGRHEAWKTTLSVRRRGPSASEVQRLRRGVAVEAGGAIVVLVLVAGLVDARTAQVSYAGQRLVASEQAAAAPVLAQPAASVPASAAPASAAPASNVARARQANARVPFTAASGEKGFVELLVAPVALGATDVHVTVVNAAGSPFDVSGLRASLVPPGGASAPLQVEQFGPGHYASVGASLTAKGAWQIVVTLITPSGGWATVKADLPVT
jgi:copper transport protein